MQATSSGLEVLEAGKATGAGLELFESRLTARKVSTRKAFDPTIIAALIAAVLPLIMNCFNPTPAALRWRLFNRTLVAMAIRRVRRDLSYAQAFVEADILFDLADEATDAELQLLIDDCCK
jgi:hypothetical protein